MVPSLSPHFLSLYLEVSKQDHRIRVFAVVRPDVDHPLVFHGGDLTAALTKLDDFADGANFLLGHNLINFNLPHLKAAKSDLRILKLTPVDTLWLNPLAFPRNPYHHLVKHYQEQRSIGASLPRLRKMRCLRGCGAGVGVRTRTRVAHQNMFIQNFP
ncbi:MAG: hypothetical protein F4W91_22385 [Gemmatimonadetes bacterium]|nr:hypothetical protein [Gemmatimonadota bacterium]